MDTKSRNDMRPACFALANKTAATPGYMPLVNDTVYFELIQEIFRWATAEDRQSDSMLMDTASAAAMADNGVVPCATLPCILYGDTAPPAWNECPAVRLCAPPEWLTGEDRFCLLHTHEATLTLFGSYGDNGSESINPFSGGWTPGPAAAAGLLLALPGAPLAPKNDSSAPLRESIAQRLTRKHIAFLDHRNSHMIMERGNLLSVLELIKAISDKQNSQIILQVFVDQIARTVPSERCSVVRIWEGESCGHVLASHDNLELRNYIIDLDKYPEVGAALDTKSKIVINNIPGHPLTRPFADVLNNAGIVSLLVIPVMLHDPQIGSLLLRAARRHAPFSEQEINFFEVVAETASNALERAHLLESIQLANVRLEQMAITDALTGLFNRRYLNMRLEEEFERTARYRVPLSCIIIDTDNFKEINDRYGHVAGDDVLREIAERMTANSRRVDLLARYGGDEFVIILPQTPLRGAMTEAERLCTAVSGQPFRDLPAGITVSVSIGVAEAEPTAMQTFEDLLRAADAALYRAKQSGKNRAAS